MSDHQNIVRIKALYDALEELADHVVFVDPNPMRTRENVRSIHIFIRDTVLRDVPGLGIEHAGIGAPVGRIPNISFGIAAYIVRSKQFTWQFVLGDHYFG